MKLNVKNLAKSIVIPLGVGIIVGLLTSSNAKYNDLVQPSFAPPAILFPIVWTILYILMGISNYIVKEKNADQDTLTVYNLQLGVNLLWSFFFFTFRFYFLSFLWIILLIILVIIMIKKFYKISPLSAYLQIPYLIWLIFACILNLSIYILN